MTGLGETGLDTQKVMRVVQALLKAGPPPRTKTSLALRSNQTARGTLDKVIKYAQPVRSDTYADIDDGLGLPGGTLEAIGYGSDPESLGLTPETLEVVLRAIGGHTSGSTRNRRVV